MLAMYNLEKSQEQSGFRIKIALDSQAEHKNVWGRFGLYLRTVRHLRVLQLLHLIKFRVFSYQTRAKNYDFSIGNLEKECGFSLDGFKIEKSPTNKDLLSFEKQKQNYWLDHSVSLLDQYSRHYFNELNIDNINDIQKISRIKTWLETVETFSQPGWDAYPLSLRIVNWIKFLRASGNRENEILSSLALQVEHLYQNIEYHLLGNHLFANAKALVFAGLNFKHKRARRYRKVGFKILKGELEEQFLTDGGHFELSPLYHSIILVDLLDLIAECRMNHKNLVLAEQEILKTMEEKSIKMHSWLQTMSHPDGKISFFNDSNFSHQFSNDDIERYMSVLNIRKYSSEGHTIDLPESGLTRLDNKRFVVLFKSSNIQSQYQPGHTHADNLSLELSLAGTRCIVNSGISTYEKSEQRDFQRSTSAHSALELNNADSDEVWASFRVGRRSKIVERCFSDGVDSSKIFASHDGYSYLPGHPIVSRSIELCQNHVEVIDWVKSAKSYPVVIRFYLHPQIQVKSVDNGDIHFSQAGIEILRMISTHELLISKSKFFPNFKSECPNTCVSMVIKPSKNIKCVTKFVKCK